MKNLLAVTLILALSLSSSAKAEAKAEKQTMRARVVVELKDGSRLVGAPLAMSLPVTLDFMTASIPLEKVRSCEIREPGARVLLNFMNGDRLTGRLELSKLEMETSLGLLSPEIAQINRMTFSTWHEGNMPAGEGSLFFGGVNWQTWRTMFEVRDDKLITLPKARPGFNYGHSGNGRGPQLFSNIGNSDWRDYRVEFEYCVSGVDPSFNPYGIGSDYHDGSFMFHVVDAKESWNECGTSGYTFAINGNGAWTLSCTYNQFCPAPIGWQNMRHDGTRTLASGRGLKIDRVNGNKYRLEVRGQHIQIWVDDERVVDVTDEKMNEMFGGKVLDHGGVGFGWGHDAMGWIRNFSATGL